MAYDKVVDSAKLDGAMAATADAIRGKTGGADSIAWDEDTGFADAVGDIEVGERVSVQQKDVNFYDYDGTRLYSYTVAEAAALTELPPLPTRRGLICQGWNWTLEDIQSVPMACDVGAMYITDDGATRLYISIWSELQRNISIMFAQSVPNGTVIDWGDGSEPQTDTIMSSHLRKHIYERTGRYTITITPAEGCDIQLGGGATQHPFFGSRAGNPSAAEKAPLRRVEIGRVKEIYQAAFNSCVALEYVSMPNGVEYIGNNTFLHCNSMMYIVIPRSVTRMTGTNLTYAYTMQGVSIPNGIENFDQSILYNNKTIDTIVIPESMKSIGTSAFYGCESLQRLVFRGSTPPTVVNSSALGNIPTTCVVEVPAGSLDAYKNATNYGGIAAQMVGV